MTFNEVLLNRDSKTKISSGETFVSMLTPSKVFVVFLLLFEPELNEQI